MVRRRWPLPLSLRTAVPVVADCESLAESEISGAHPRPLQVIILLGLKFMSKKKSSPLESAAWLLDQL